MIVTVLGATGKTGSVVAERLLAAGVKVRAVARSPDRLSALAKRGATPHPAEITDPHTVASALRGSDGAFFLIPDDLRSRDLLGHYAAVAEAVGQAVGASGLRRLVFLSSHGADLPAGTGSIAGLHAAEERLRTLRDLDLLVLRAGYFYENLYGSLELIKQQGFNGGPLAADVPMTMMSAHDVGAAAADALHQRDFAGHSVRELFGPRDLTMAEATRLLGAAIARPDLIYRQLPDQAVLASMEAAGFSREVAALFLEMSHACNQRKIRPRHPRTPQNTGRTPFESFADEFAQAYRAAG
jgi:uncharacterized protein YbjT (DUF2867 family)